MNTEKIRNKSPCEMCQFKTTCSQIRAKRYFASIFDIHNVRKNYGINDENHLGRHILVIYNKSAWRMFSKAFIEWLRNQPRILEQAPKSKTIWITYLVKKKLTPPIII